MGATHARLPVLAVLLVAISVSLVAGCNRDGGQVSLDGVADAASPWDVAQGEPEPRPGLRAGHIPGARNLPFGQLFNADGTMKDIGAIRAAFEAAGVDLSRPVIATCGSGISAASLALALERLGHRHWSLYDGSWTEWGSFPDLKIATGDA